MASTKKTRTFKDKKKLSWAPDSEGITAAIRFTPKSNTDKYLNLTMKNNSLFFESSEEPAMGCFCSPINPKNKSAHIPQVVVEGYHNLIGLHSATNGYSGTEVFVKKKKDFVYVPPKGCTYFPESEPIFEVPDCSSKLKVNPMMSSAGKWLNVTMYLSETKKYCIVQKTKTPLFDDIEDVRKHYGRKLTDFPLKGRMCFSTKRLVVPGVFYKAVGLNKRSDELLIRGNEDKTLFLITPPIEKCAVDGTQLDSALFSGIDIYRCEDCVNMNYDEAINVVRLAINSAKKAAEAMVDYKKIAKELTMSFDKIEDMEARNEAMKSPVFKKYFEQA